MKIKQASILVVILAFLSATPATSATLELVPDMTTVGLGDALFIDIVVSELGDGIAPSVGDFDFDITYDDTILTATDVEIGGFLGDLDFLEAIGGFDLSTSGVVDLFEVSFLFDFELDALQPASFTLATLSFEAIGLGMSTLDFTQVILGDSFAQPIDTTVTGGSVSVPLPPTLWLFGSSLLALVGFSKRKAQVRCAAS